MSYPKGRSVSPKQKCKVIMELLALWEKKPSLRLGQLLASAIFEDIFYIEDRELVRRVRDFVDQPSEGK